MQRILELDGARVIQVKTLLPESLKAQKSHQWVNLVI
jgi:hypothetical protein